MGRGPFGAGGDFLSGGVFPNAKVIGGYDFGSNDNDPMPEGMAHGTCCAGIAAGSLGHVGDYIGGVAYGARIYALKISVGMGGPLTDAALAAWDWCVTHRNDHPDYPIKAMSNSWGVGIPFDDPVVGDAYSPAFTIAAIVFRRRGESSVSSEVGTSCAASSSIVILRRRVTAGDRSCRRWE